MFQAKLDGTGSDARLPRNIGKGAADASDVRFIPGAIELTILKGPAETGINLNTPALLKYVLELDFLMRPGSELTFFINLRWNNTQRMGYSLIINPTNESLLLRFVHQSVQPPVTEVLTSAVPVPGLGTGRVFTLTAVVDEARYRLFLDGTQVGDVTDARVPVPMTPFLGVSGNTGTVRVEGVRIYAFRGVAETSSSTSTLTTTPATQSPAPHTVKLWPSLPPGGIGWDPGVPGGIPDVSVAANVKDFGAKGDGVASDSAAFEAALRSVAKGAILVPSGTYLLTGPLVVNKNVVLRGEGAEKTHLMFNLSGSTAPAISFRGQQTGAWTNLASGYTKGSTTLRVDASGSAAAFRPGAFAVLREANDPAVMYTDPMWKQAWAESAVGQVVKVVSQSGDTVTIEDPLRMDYQPSLSPQIRGIEPVQHAGIESLHLKRLDRGDAHMVSFTEAAYCWVRQAESEYALRAHIYVGTGYACEIRDNYIHHAHDYGGGGHGYGVELIRYTTKVLVENNIFAHLRHSMMAHVGATGNVFGYNYSREPYTDTGPLPDVSLHGHYPSFNLVEGNIVQEIGISDYWGPVDPGNVYLRNRVEAKDIFVRDHSHLQYIIGNELVNGKIAVHGSVTGTVMDGNLIKGQISWTLASPRDQGIPTSLYHGAKPAFYGGMAWPSVGADVPGGTNPARERYRSGEKIPTTAEAPAHY